MLKRFARRINLNFKRSSGDRASIVSYRAYHAQAKRLIDKFKNFKKVSKNY